MSDTSNPLGPCPHCGDARVICKSCSALRVPPALLAGALEQLAATVNEGAESPTSPAAAAVADMHGALVWVIEARTEGNAGEAVGVTATANAVAGCCPDGEWKVNTEGVLLCIAPPGWDCDELVATPMRIGHAVRNDLERREAATLSALDASRASCSLCKGSGMWGTDAAGHVAPCGGNAVNRYLCYAGNRYDRDVYATISGGRMWDVGDMCDGPNCPHATSVPVAWVSARGLLCAECDLITGHERDV